MIEAALLDDGWFTGPQAREILGLSGSGAFSTGRKLGRRLGVETPGSGRRVWLTVRQVAAGMVLTEVTAGAHGGDHGSPQASALADIIARKLMRSDHWPEYLVMTPPHGAWFVETAEAAVAEARTATCATIVPLRAYFDRVIEVAA